MLINSGNKKVGSANHSVKSFTKDDFLTKRFLAAKFKESAELIEKTLKYMKSHGVSFSVNGHKAPVVTYGGLHVLRVHPLAVDVFQEYLNKQKAKA